MEIYGSSSIHLTVGFDDLDSTRRKLIWDSLQQSLGREKHRNVRLSDSASNLLNNSEVHELKWNGHAINRCFKTAVALAEFDATRSLTYDNGDEIVVDDEHFKDAINMTNKSNTYQMNSNNSSPRPHADNSLGHPPAPSRSLRAPKGSKPSRIMDALEENPWPITSDTDINLCIPQLNCVEWEEFKTAANSELFRKTSFYAIDVLVKEPRIVFQARKNDRRRRQPLNRNKADQSPSEHKKSEAGSDGIVLLPGQAPLPERIRINSSSILKVFQDINGDLDPNSATLLFRPFRSLVYYEHEFREWVTRQETKLQSKRQCS